MDRNYASDRVELSALYEEVDTLDPGQLAVRLRELRAEDHRLLSSLQRMLAARSRLEQQRFLEDLPALLDGEEWSAATGWQAGDRFGGYVLVNRIGVGRMADVWQAHRAEGTFPHEVALKLLFRHPPVGRRDVFLERFARERDILASLDLPHIARLHHAGVGAEGQPWLALDLMRGETLTGWCDRQRLSIAERVDHEGISPARAAGAVDLAAQTTGWFEWGRSDGPERHPFHPSVGYACRMTDITRDEIADARTRIAGDVRRTPLMRIAGRQLGIDCAELWLKLEHLQVGGSFKARGMFNRMRSNPVPEAGVVIASGGNAGIAVACAAKAMGVRCEVFVPEAASPAKRDKLAELGAVLTVTGASYGDALAASLARQAQTGALLMHAYDQREVVIGAGTLAAEVEEEAGVPDRVLVSVGGGGLIAGVASWFAGRCWIDALEPELAPTLHRAREAGEPVDVAVSGIAADSLGARRIGAIAWDVAQRHVDATHLLTDASIRKAQLAMWKELRLAVEPAAALPLAALQAGVVATRADERVLLVICGANLDLATLGV